MSIYAKVIADSINGDGDRLTTLEVQMHRFVLAEFNTHRAFSRNSASSRAIPFEKQIARMEELGLAFPLSWPKEQKGMSGGEELSEDAIIQLRQAWGHAAMMSIQVATAMHTAKLHKSVINRLLEPFMWHKVIVSATEWDNFFKQRCSPLAQPEIQAVAYAMSDALQKSEPQLLGPTDFHLPYIDDLTRSETKGDIAKLAKISAARCARVSYLTHDGVRDTKEDIDMYCRLVSADPGHWSPLEHVATPASPLILNAGNFTGWAQLRHNLEMI